MADNRRAAQGNVDRLADLMLDLTVSGALMAEMQEPVRRAISQAKSLEELRDRLAELYNEMNTEELEDLLQRALYAADLYGRYVVING